MLSQACLVLICLFADWALVRHFLTLMLLHVLAQVTSRAKLLVAYFTLIGFVTGVDASVADQITHLREGSTAFLAFVRLTLFMYSHVFLQWGELSERLIALVTLVGPFTCVSSCMLLHRLLTCEHSITIGVHAHELLLFLCLARAIILLCCRCSVCSTLSNFWNIHIRSSNLKFRVINN